MNASRSPRELISEISISDTNAKSRLVRPAAAGPLERRADQISITRLKPTRDLASKQLAGYIAQLFQVRREHFLLTSKVQIQCEQDFIPRFETPTELLIIGLQGRGGI